MRKLRIWKSMFPWTGVKMCQQIMDTQVLRSYNLPHANADLQNPKSTTRSDLLERGHGKRKHILAFTFQKARNGISLFMTKWPILAPSYSSFIAWPCPWSTFNGAHQLQLVSWAHHAWALFEGWTSESVFPQWRKLKMETWNDSFPAKKSARWNCETMLWDPSGCNRPS